MTASSARKQNVQNWAALADEIVRRERQFFDAAYDRGPTPLEGLRVALTARRRPNPLRTVVPAWPTLRGWLKIELPDVANDNVHDVHVEQPRRAGRKALKFACLSSVAIPLIALGFHVASPATTEALTRGLIASIPNNAVKAIDEARACAEARPIVDANKALVSISPTNACATKRPFLTAPVSAKAAAMMHLAWRASEGEYRISPVTFHGLNLKGWSRAALQQFGLGGSSGGSNPLESGLKNLLDRPGLLGFTTKLRNGFDVLSYTAQRLANDADRDRFVTESVPCVRGAKASAFGHKLAGNLCAWYFFGKDAEELDWAERCIWTGSALPLYRATGTDTPDDAADMAAQAKAKIRTRAKDCVARVGRELGWDASQIATLTARIDAIEFPVAPILQKQEDGIETVNLEDALPGLTFALRDELKTARVAGEERIIQLNVASGNHGRTYEKVMTTAAAFEARLDASLCLTKCTDEKRQADLVAILAEIRGDQLAIIQGITNAHFLLSGPIIERDGQYERARTTRSGGSTNKSMLLPKLVAEGLTTLCGRVPVGLRGQLAGTNGDEQPCAGGNGLVSLRQATAISMNSPFADGVYKVGIDKAKDYFARLGYDFDPDLDGAKAVDGLVLGWGFTAAPITLVRNFAGLYRGYLGEEPVSGFPKLIATNSPTGRFDWRDVGLSTAQLRQAAQFLSAPIQENDGTLHTLAPILKRNGCSDPIGKTGTSDSVVATAVRDKLAVAAFRCQGRKYVAYVMVGSPRVDVPLGSVRASDLAQIIGAMLSTRQPTRSAP